MWPQWESKRGRWSEKLCETWIVRDRLLKNFAKDVCPTFFLHIAAFFNSIAHIICISL